jgi:hypothetical protein
MDEIPIARIETTKTWYRNGQKSMPYSTNVLPDQSKKVSSDLRYQKYKKLFKKGILQWLI